MNAPIHFPDDIIANIFILLWKTSDKAELSKEFTNYMCVSHQFKLITEKISYYFYINRYKSFDEYTKCDAINDCKTTNKGHWINKDNDTKN